MAKAKATGKAAGAKPAAAKKATAKKPTAAKKTTKKATAKKPAAPKKTAERATAEKATTGKRAAPPYEGPLAHIRALPTAAVEAGALEVAADAVPARPADIVVRLVYE